MDYTKGLHRTSGTAWTALFLAILALIFAWVAFNRSGQNLEDIVREEVQETAQATEQRFQQLELRLRGEVSNDLRGAANDAAVDSDPDNVGE